MAASPKVFTLAMRLHRASPAGDFAEYGCVDERTTRLSCRISSRSVSDAGADSTAFIVIPFSIGLTHRPSIRALADAFIRTCHNSAGPYPAPLCLDTARSAGQTMNEHDERHQRPIRIGVADKSPLVQAALTHIFEADPRFELIGVWPDGEGLLQAVDDCDLDVVICGWVIGPGDGKYILDRLRMRPNAPRVVIYTGAASDAIPAQAMAHGAAAYVSKSERPELLLDTIEAVAEGRVFRGEAENVLRLAGAACCRRSMSAR